MLLVWLLVIFFVDFLTAAEQDPKRKKSAEGIEVPSGKQVHAHLLIDNSKQQWKEIYGIRLDTNLHCKLCNIKVGKYANYYNLLSHLKGKWHKNEPLNLPETYEKNSKVDSHKRDSKEFYFNT